MIEYNHNRPLSEFQPYIDLLIAAGYKPIAVTQLYFEDTFVFETDEEALRAYHEFEDRAGGSEIWGWWYGREEFLKTVDNYEKEGGNKVFVHWLNK